MFLIPKSIRGILARLTFPFYLAYLQFAPKPRGRKTAGWQTWRDNFQQWQDKWQSF